MKLANNVLKRIIITGLFVLAVFMLVACNDETTTNTTIPVTTTAPTSIEPSTGQTTTNLTIPEWDYQSITYQAAHIRTFGSGTPAGTVNYDALEDEAVIWNTDASLDNYGGIQTPTLRLDFSKAVIFQMEVVDVYAEYIVKLAVEGESEYYYVLSDDPRLGLISVNVVDAMLSEKYRTRVTMPDPGYQDGWKYDGEIKNCSFHILAKGPDGERQTAELVIKSISVYNDQTAIESIEVNSPALEDGKIERLKGSAPVQLSTVLTPSTGVDTQVFWTSADPAIALVSESGSLAFIGVGATTVSATSAIDQSKTATIEINVLSGYESESDLINRLDELTYGGSSSDASSFLDLFQTTWGTEITQAIALDHQILKLRDQGQVKIIENYFDSTDQDHLLLAATELGSGGSVSALLELEELTEATIYWHASGKLYKVEEAVNFAIPYATNNAGYEKNTGYSLQLIVVSSTNQARKVEIQVIPTTLMANYEPADFMNTDYWTIPDRTKQTIDPVVHQLSPASLALDSGILVLKQNKYPEAKYCFGGIVSSVFQSPIGTEVEIVLDVVGLNQMNDYVKTMWEVKILYFHDEAGQFAISSNPLKLASGNKTSLQSLVFTPAYQYYRIYLVANGSDIGAQFADAEVRIASLKIQTRE